MKYYQLPVWLDTFQLLTALYSEPQFISLPREMKATVLKDLCDETVTLLDYICEAHASGSEEKKTAIEKAKRMVSRLYVRVRLLYTLHHINEKFYLSFSERIFTIGKQLGAWGKAHDSQKEAPTYQSPGKR